MKKVLIITAVLFSAFPLFGQGRLQALFGYSTFYLPDQHTPYIETYLSLDAWTMQFVPFSNGTYQATAEVLILLKQGDSIAYFKKYDLHSPTVATLDELDFSFIDLQRFPVKNGIYDIQLTLRDKNTDHDAAILAEKVIINYDDAHPAISSLQLIASATPTEQENNLSRGGYDLEPYISDFLPEQVEQLNFYYEIYNIDRETGRKPFLALAYIEQRETGSRFEGIQLARRKYSQPLVPVYGSLDISSLPSGNFNLCVELRNADNQLMLYKKLPFFRSNPGVMGKAISDFAATFAGQYTDESQLNLYLDALYPVASDLERQTVADLIRKPGLEEKQAFLYRFWTKRDPIAPETEWLKYKERVDYVQSTFSYSRTPGIHTDRGRVYLLYGPPDFVRDEKNYVSARHLNAGHSNNKLNTLQSEGTAADDMFASPSQGHIYYLPYQLWRYNQLPTDEPNRVFLFWDEHRSGHYKLLNSNVRGEVQEPDWERRLCRQQLPENTVGAVGEQFNRGY